MAEQTLKFYGLFDAALIPKIWFNLETLGLNFASLYQGDYAPIAEAIPYVIELDKSLNSNSVEALLEQGDYHLGLFIMSSLSLDELTKRLAFFYHVEDDRGIPYLRRFFDIRLFDHFLKTLSANEIAYLFDKETSFYHFHSTETNACRMYAENESHLITYSDYADITEIKKLRQFLPHLKE
ncbi:hypothetical protein BKK56_01775 [Rodentibacter genomosp. 2]|uniref:DUF4123 domain-containing protein n=1 Tax=Rodentibacter genomosp. 2 TaxID=1908266 RepID=UPI0009854395|nr:hypothetical protein BKK56_01775 [Rodentibacter genomosp. 2]